MPPTILIIEEHDLLRQALQTWLQVMFSDCYVVEATNVTEAINLSSTFPPQVVLVDMETSNGAGIKIIDRIKEAIPNVPVAILTSYGPGTFPTRAVAGASAHISKTAICSQLKAALTDLLQPTKSEPKAQKGGL